MKLVWSTSEHPQILILVVFLMHAELKFTTIKVTTGLTVEETRNGLIGLIEAKIVEKLSNRARNPAFRLLDANRAREYLDMLAKQLSYK